MEQATGGGVEQEKQNVRTMALGFVGLVIVVVIAALGVGMYRVYAKTASDSFTLMVAKVLRLPAAKVNGETILYSEYAGDLAAISKLRDYDRAHPAEQGGAADLQDDEMSDQVLIRLVNNILVNEAAVSMGVTVTDADIEKVYEQLKTKFGSIDAAAKGLNDHYGWTMAQYEARVMRPLILQNKIGATINADVSAKVAVKATAQKTLDQIKSGANFEDMAKQYGQDATAAKGGDLGEFKSGDMVPEFEAALAKLKAGELAPELVETEFGYHLVRLDEMHKKGEVMKGEETPGGKIVVLKDAKGKNRVYTETTYKAHHILFSYPTLNLKLSELLKKASIHFYLRTHNPFDLTGKSGSQS